MLQFSREFPTMSLPALSPEMHCFCPSVTIAEYHVLGTMLPTLFSVQFVALFLHNAHSSASASSLIRSCTTSSASRMTSFRKAVATLTSSRRCQGVYCGRFFASGTGIVNPHIALRFGTVCCGNIERHFYSCGKCGRRRSQLRSIY